MKNQERKENANKGFSLVELIVVVAIMAVLLVVLTPQYLRYVERTRLQKDNTAISDIVEAVKLGLADETILTGTTFPVTIPLTGGTGNNKTVALPGDVTGPAAALGTELESTVGATYATSSNTYRNSNADIVIQVTINNGIPEVIVGGWINAVGGNPGTMTFDATPTFNEGGTLPAPTP